MATTLGDPRRSSALVTVGVPTEAAAAEELYQWHRSVSLRMYAGKAVSWLSLCWSRGTQVSNQNVPGH